MVEHIGVTKHADLRHRQRYGSSIHRSATYILEHGLNKHDFRRQSSLSKWMRERERRHLKNYDNRAICVIFDKKAYIISTDEKPAIITVLPIPNKFLYDYEF